MKQVSVVIPVYNEEENVVPLCNELIPVLKSLCFPFEIIFVNDGSTDDSHKIIASMQKESANITTIAFKKNKGQTAAFWAGIKHAKGDIIALMDADLQNNPSDLPRMIELCSEYDMVCGWRKKRNDNLWRKIQSKVANQIRNWILKDDIRDSGCSLKVFKKPPDDWLPDCKGLHRFIPAIMKMNGYTITQIPVLHRPRRNGTTKYGLKNRGLQATFDLFGVFWMRMRHF